MKATTAIAHGLKKAAPAIHLIHGCIPTTGSARELMNDLIGSLKDCDLLELIKIPTAGCDEDQTFSLGASLSEMFQSSSRSLGNLRGLEIPVKALFTAWSDRLTSRFRLSRVECHRDEAGAHHEYLIASIVDENNPSATGSLWLRLERRPRQALRRRDYVRSIAGGFEAHDTVTIASRREDLAPSSEMQASMSFDSPISLRYMLEILKIIHEESPEYHVVGAHCWFFAAVFVEALEFTNCGIWDSGRTDWRDHWKSKNYLNNRQYQAIVTRLQRIRYGRILFQSAYAPNLRV